MNQTRRAFLRSILAAAAAGTLLTDTKLSEAAAALVKDPIAVTVRLSRTVLAAHLSETAAAKTLPAPDRWARPQTNGATNALLAYMDGAFEGLPTQQEVCDLFSGKIRVDALDDAALRALTARLVPLAVARSLLAHHRIHFEPRHVPAFGPFVRRYETLILSVDRPSLVA